MIVYGSSGNICVSRNDGISGCCVWQMIIKTHIKTHIRENRFHGNRSVHPQKLPTT